MYYELRHYIVRTEINIIGIEAAHVRMEKNVFLCNLFWVFFFCFGFCYFHFVLIVKGKRESIEFNFCSTITMRRQWQQLINLRRQSVLCKFMIIIYRRKIIYLHLRSNKLYMRDCLHQKRCSPVKVGTVLSTVGKNLLHKSMRFQPHSRIVAARCVKQYWAIRVCCTRASSAFWCSVFMGISSILLVYIVTIIIIMNTYRAPRCRLSWVFRIWIALHSAFGINCTWISHAP